MIGETSIREALGRGEGVEVLTDGWAASQAQLPREPLFFLEPGFVAVASTEAGLTTEFSAALSAAAQRIEGMAEARALAWHVYQRLRHDAVAEDWAGHGWPLPSVLLGEQAGLLYVLALLGGLPDLRAFYAAHGVTETVARATLADIQRNATQYRREHGAWGLTPRHLSWLRLHLSGGIFELERLQFEPGIWRRPARAYRQHGSGRVTALSEGGVRYRADGQRDGAGGVYDGEGAWIARLEQDVTEIVGHRIRPTGQAEREETRLARTEWSTVLEEGDPVLNIHIPEGAPLEMGACRAALEQALSFFRAHFPARPIVAFSCSSWLLDAQLEDLLPATSNLVRFLRQMYVLPVLSDGQALFDYVFDGVPTDAEHAPRNTTLRRAVLDHLQRGGHLRGGACFLLPADLPRWGSDIYR